MIVQMFKELGRRLDGQSETLDAFNEEWKNIKKNQTETKNIIIEIKNTLEGINRRLEDTEEWISKPEDTVVEITDSQQKRE